MSDKKLISKVGKYHVWAQLIRPDTSVKLPTTLRFTTTYTDSDDANENSRVVFDLALDVAERRQLLELLLEFDPRVETHR